MPCWERQTCQKKTFSTCAITSLVLLVGSLVFGVIFLTFSWHDTAEKNDIQDMTHDDPGDSMYDDCVPKPTVVADKHMTQKWDRINLSQSWDDAEQKAQEPAHTYMRKKHSIAIYMYTNATLLPVNQDYKTAARPGERTVDTETSDHRSLYFYLSEAIQILKHSQVSCLNAYYRTEAFLNLNISNKQMRFSTFILSSLNRNINSLRSVCCFEIYTCFGAEITQYSALQQDGQVLIPPYEVFTVTGIQTDAQWCKVAYRLRSNLNCVYDRGSDTLHPISASPTDSFWPIIIISSIIVASLLLLFVIVKVLGKCKQIAVYSVSPIHNDTYSSGVVI
ncbi:ecto-ADP-ribosyltransferase 5-like [Centroberyx gerrardi]